MTLQGKRFWGNFFFFIKTIGNKKKALGGGETRKTCKIRFLVVVFQPSTKNSAAGAPGFRDVFEQQQPKKKKNFFFKESLPPPPVSSSAKHNIPSPATLQKEIFFFEIFLGIFFFPRFAPGLFDFFRNASGGGGGMQPSRPILGFSPQKSTRTSRGKENNIRRKKNPARFFGKRFVK